MVYLKDNRCEKSNKRKCSSQYTRKIITAWASDFKGKPFENKYISFSAKAQGMNALTLEIISGGERQQVTVMGARMVHPPVTVKVNQLDFHLSYGSIYVAMPFSIKLNDFMPKNTQVLKIVIRLSKAK